MAPAGRVDHEFAQQLAVRGDDPDVSGGDEQGHGFVLVGPPDGDVTEAAEVAARSPCR